MTTFLIALASCLLLASPARAAVYVAAHADDIALFMAQSAWTDLQQGDATVFILITASDDGHGDYLPNPTGKSFMRARQAGHERAVRFWLGSGGYPVADTVNAPTLINGKSIERSVIDHHLTLYQFNLPDGSYDGSGYPTTGNQSLSKLLAGTIRSISAVTASNPTSYTLSELQGTLRAILLQHGHGVPVFWLNMLDEHPANNPADHADHSAASRLLASVLAIAPLQCINVARYTSYANAGKPVNMAPGARDYHVGTWAVLNSGLIDGGNHSTWDDTHNGWLGRQYLSVQSGNAPCHF